MSQGNGAKFKPWRMHDFHGLEREHQIEPWPCPTWPKLVHRSPKNRFFLELVSLPKMQLGLSTTKNTLSFRKCWTKNQNREPRVQILPFRPVLGRSRPALPNGFAVKSFWFFKKVGDQVVRKLRVGAPETEMKQFRTIYSKPLRKWGSLGYKKSRQSRLKMRNTMI